MLAATIAFAGLALGLRSHWNSQHRVSITGDEPHYILASRALNYDHSLSTANQYAKSPFPGTIPAHAIVTKHGWLSVHGLGLPAFIALGDRLGGLAGIRFTMLLFGLGIVVVAFAGARLALLSNRLASLFALIFGASAPWLGAATQIYPDLPAGVIAASAVYVLIRRTQQPTERSWARLLLLTALAAVPFLHLRVLSPAALLTLTIIYFRRRPRFATACLEAGPFAISVALLFSYHLVGFGSLLGPYTSDSVSINATAMSVLFGLHLDQFQGMFIIQPLLLFAVPGLGILWKRSRSLTGILIALHLLLVIPSALHPTWYGGSSFAGRFGIAAALALATPAALGFAALTNAARRLAFGALAVVVIIEVFAYRALWIGSTPLLAQPARLPQRWYPSWIPALRAWLPAVNRLTWSLHNPINYLFPFTCIAGISTITIIALRARRSRRLWATTTFAALVIATMITGLLTPSHDQTVLALTDSVKRPGTLTDSGIAAPRGTTGETQIVATPTMLMRDRAHWAITIRYRAAPPNPSTITDMGLGQHSAPAGFVDLLLTPTSGATTTCRVALDQVVASTATTSIDFAARSDGTAFNLKISAMPNRELVVAAIDLRPSTTPRLAAVLCPRV